MSYTARLGRNSKTNVMLVDLESSLEISRNVNSALAWTATTNYANVFQTPVAISTHGIKREVTNVYVTGTLYTRVNSLYECNAVDSSWVYDLAGGQLYINPAGSTDLDTQITDVCFVSHYGTADKVFAVGSGDLVRYLGFVAPGANIGKVSITANDKYFNSLAISGGNLVLANGRSEFDALLGAYNYIGHRVTIWHGADLPNDPAPYSDYQKVRVAYVAAYDRNDANLTFALQQANRRLAVQAGITSFSTDNDTGDPSNQLAYPAMQLDKEGKIQPISIGKHDATSTDLSLLFQNGIPTTIVDQGTFGGGGLNTNVKVKASTTFVDPETGSTIGHLAPQMVLRRQNGNGGIIDKTNAYSTQETNSAMLFTSSYQVNINSDEVRVIPDAHRDDTRGKFTGTASSAIKLPQDLIHLWSVLAGLRTSELVVSSLTATTVQKWVTQINFAANAGDTTIRAYNPEAFIVGDKIDIGNDTNSGAGYTVTDITAGVATISPALGTSQAAGLGVYVHGTLSTALMAWYEAQKGYITQQWTFQQIIDKITMGMRAVYRLRYDGRMELVLINPTPQATDAVITDRMMSADWVEHLALDYVCSRVVVQLKQMGATETYKRKKNSGTLSIGGKNVSQAIAGSLYAYQKEDTVTTWLVHSNNAIALANSYYTTFSRPLIEAKVTVNAINGALSALPGDRVLVYRSRAVGGSDNEKCFFIKTVETDYAQSTATLTLLEAR